MRRPLLILAAGAVAIVAILGARWLAGPGDPPRNLPVIVRSVDADSHEEPAAGPEQPDPTAGPRLLVPGDPVPEVTLVDHLGRTFSTANLQGSTVVVAFLYTHCNLPSMCPLTAGKFAEAREAVDREEIPEVLFLLVSFDTARDDPGSLRRFARRFGLDRPGVILATGAPVDVGRLSRALKTFYRPTVEGEFDHNIVVSILDRDGRLGGELYGPEWRQEDLLEALRSLSVKT